MAINNKPTAKISQKILIQSYIDSALGPEISAAVASLGLSSTAKFVERAVISELSRHSLCIPQENIGISDIAAKLTQIHDLLSRGNTENKISAAKISAIAEAVGV